MRVLKVQQITNKTEQKLGDLFWNVFRKSEQENRDSLVVGKMDSIVSHICDANKIDRKRLKVHVLMNNQVNAFALPDGHLVIYSGLIARVENQEELVGVICHELAHIQLNHVMKKLVKEVGLSVLLSMTTGNTGAEVIKETAKLLSSSAFDRSMEKEADIKAVDYLINANVNPEPFANFLCKLSKGDDDTNKYLSWVSTHPDSQERAEYVFKYSNGRGNSYKSILSSAGWKELKDRSSQTSE
ncbi:M48 family metallopeptidase [Sphingobacterium sp. lm-10]|uniref:M48 family metallopeptidase n=1 Tax=Sphingobacterium sp. lm-10 TaxID=2944904 RepID=UPI002020D6B0|nr:M48 family metallopeptidase [Sphingobacterium sp. lm-10]MCL7988297.1 M48 family metallopeptidase [Sphingobacterium sp. lm-10]